MTGGIEELLLERRLIEQEASLDFLGKVLHEGSPAYRKLSKPFSEEELRRSIGTTLGFSRELASAYPEFGEDPARMAANFETSQREADRMEIAWLALDAIQNAGEDGGLVDVPCRFPGGKTRVLKTYSAILSSATGLRYSEDVALVGREDPRVPWKYAFPNAEKAEYWKDEGQFDGLFACFDGVPQRTRKELEKVSWIAHKMDSSSILAQNLESKDDLGVLWMPDLHFFAGETPKIMDGALVHEMDHYERLRSYDGAPPNVFLLEGLAISAELERLDELSGCEERFRYCSEMREPYVQTALNGRSSDISHYLFDVKNHLALAQSSLPARERRRSGPILSGFFGGVRQ
jgi:hypothetical protein